MVNSYFEGVYIKTQWIERSLERIGSLKDLKDIKTTCANLGIDLKKDDIVLNTNKDTILNKLITFGASEDENGNLYQNIGILFWFLKFLIVVDSIDVFMLFVMSHGDLNGVIHTDFLRSGKQFTAKKFYRDFKDFEEYSIDEIFNAVNSNPNLTNSLIIIVIQVLINRKI